MRKIKKVSKDTEEDISFELDKLDSMMHKSRSRYFRRCIRVMEESNKLLFSGKKVDSSEKYIKAWEIYARLDYFEKKELYQELKSLYEKLKEDHAKPD